MFLVGSWYVNELFGGKRQDKSDLKTFSGDPPPLSPPYEVLGREVLFFKAKRLIYSTLSNTFWPRGACVGCLAKYKNRLPISKRRPIHPLCGGERD